MHLFYLVHMHEFMLQRNMTWPFTLTNAKGACLLLSSRTRATNAAIFIIKFLRSAKAYITLCVTRTIHVCLCLRIPTGIISWTCQQTSFLLAPTQNVPAETCACKYTHTHTRIHTSQTHYCSHFASIYALYRYFR